MESEFEHVFKQGISIIVPYTIVAIEAEFYPLKLDGGNREKLTQIAKELFEKHKQVFQEMYLRKQTIISKSEREEINKVLGNLGLQILSEIKQTKGFLEIEAHMKKQKSHNPLV